MSIGVVTIPGLLIPGWPFPFIAPVPADSATAVDTAIVLLRVPGDTGTAVDTARALFNVGPFNGPRVATVMPEIRVTQVAKDNVHG